MEEILVDENGYKQFFEELDKLKLNLQNNATSGAEAYKDAVGDGWHDNFAFEESMRMERNIASRINTMLKEQHKLKVIKKTKHNDQIINIDDIVKIQVKYSCDDIEEYKVKLTGKYLPDKEEEISLNSPIGKAIYLKNISDKILCEINGNTVEIVILEKNSL